MNGTNVSSDLNSSNLAANDALDPAARLEQLSQQVADLSPQERKAAIYVLENPNTVGVSTVRELAEAAAVKPNTLVRMARSLGFEGYDEFRAPFREEIRAGNLNFPDRARWLQSLSHEGEMGNLYADLADSALSNIESTFANIDHEKLKAAADAIVAAERSFVLGVGVYNTLSHNFAYLANMAVDKVTAIPKAGSNLVDDLLRASEGDVVLAMTFKPYRKEVVDAVKLAKQQGVTLIVITDSLAAPFVADSDFVFITACDTPQFFPSTVATIALLETLMAFVVADADQEIVDSIERFHQRRHLLGLYVEPHT